MREEISFVIGAVIFIGVLFLLRDDTAKRIRNSPFWFIGWAAYVFGLSFAARLMLPVLNRVPVNDDIAVPILFVVVFFAALVMFVVNIYQLRRNKRRSCANQARHSS